MNIGYVVREKRYKLSQDFDFYNGDSITIEWNVNREKMEKFYKTRLAILNTELKTWKKEQGIYTVKWCRDDDCVELSFESLDKDE